MTAALDSWRAAVIWAHSAGTFSRRFAWFGRLMWPLSATVHLIAAAAHADQLRVHEGAAIILGRERGRPRVGAPRSSPPAPPRGRPRPGRRPMTAPPRRRGHGDVLMHRVAAELDAHSASAVLTCRRDLRHWYRTHGFVDQGPVMVRPAHRTGQASAATAAATAADTPG